MPGMYESDQPMKRQELGDTIYIAESTKTPFTRLVPRGPQPNQMLSEWPVQSYPARGFGGTVDGYDISSFNSTTRDKLSGYGMWLMSEGWMASKLATLTKAAGVGRKERAKQKTDDALILALMHEKQILSNVDTRQESKPNTSYRSRAAFSWLSATAQGVLPVPEDYRPAAACVYTDALGDFDADAFEAMIEAAADARKGPVHLTGYLGIKLKRQMSTWGQRDSDQANKTFVQRFNINASEKKFMEVVDFFEFDAGTVTTMPTWNIMCDETTGEATDYTTRSGLFVEMRMWRLRFLQGPQSYDEPPKSGGPRGYSDLVFILECLNPLGQCAVLTDSDS